VRYLRAVPTRTSVAEVWLLPIFAGEIYSLAAPIALQVAPCNIMLETAVRPITDPADQPVLDGVEMNVIDVPLEIGIISDCMLPIPPLPQASLAFDDLAGRARDIDGQTS
jgi:hypothetical protein